jgi:hypothetical protein
VFTFISESYILLFCCVKLFHCVPFLSRSKMKLKLEKTSKGKNAVLHGGYLFRKDRILTTGLITWRCLINGCKSSIKTDSDHCLVRDSIHAHSHLPSGNNMSSLTCDGSVSRSAACTSAVSSGEPGFSLVADESALSCHLNTEHDFHDISFCDLPDESGTMENEELRMENSVLREQRDAMLNHSIDLERRLIELGVDKVDASCQTDLDEVSTSHRDQVMLMPKIFVNRQSQTHLPDSHQCAHLTNKIKNLQVTIAEHKMLIQERDLELESLMKRLEETREMVRELQSHLLSLGWDSFAPGIGSGRMLRKGKMEKSLLVPLNNTSSKKQVTPIVSQNQKRLIVVGDSHARNLLPRLRSALPCDVIPTIYAFPGAPMTNILNSSLFKGELSELSGNDQLCIIGGLNGCCSKNHVKEAYSYVQILQDIVSKEREFDVSVCTLPYRYDLHANAWENEIAKTVNESIRELKGVRVIDLWTVNRDLHTRHGQHFNRKGKLWLTNELVEGLNKSIHNFGTNPKNRNAQTVEKETDCLFVTDDPLSSEGIETISVNDTLQNYFLEIDDESQDAIGT